MNRRHISVKERDAIIYAWHNKCAYCRKVNDTFHIDHVIPHSKGGSCDLENLVPACVDCNQTKSAYLIPDEYIGIVLSKALAKKPKIENRLAEHIRRGETNMQVELLTLGQASKLVKVSKPTISKAVKDKKLKGKKVDGVFQIQKSELLKVYPTRHPIIRHRSRGRGEENNIQMELLTLGLDNERLKEQVSELKMRLAHANSQVEMYESRERNVLNTIVSIYSGG